MRSNKQFIKKNLTGSGIPSKQYVRIHKNEMGVGVIVFLKYLLVTDLEYYRKLGFTNMKTFKGKYLVFQWYSLKVETLEEVCSHFFTGN